MTHKRKARWQQFLVLLVALLIVLTSVGSTLHFTGVLTPATGGSSASISSGYRNVTFTDAYLECQSYTRERYASRLQSMVSDDHSSRYDDSEKLYKIFLKLQMRKPPAAPMPQPYWVNCFVSATDGRLVRYEVGQARNRPARGGQTRSFGW